MEAAPIGGEVERVVMERMRKEKIHGNLMFPPLSYPKTRFPNISTYLQLFCTTPFIVVIIKLSHFYVTTILLPFPLRNHFSNTSPKLQVI